MKFRRICVLYFMKKSHKTFKVQSWKNICTTGLKQPLYHILSLMISIYTIMTYRNTL